MADTIEKIKNTINIVDFISTYVNLRQKGSNYFGKCPFHGENNASFSVSEEKQMFYCFGCHLHGDIIDFHAKYNGISNIKESIVDICCAYGIEISDKYGNEAKNKTSKYEINKSANNNFINNLNRNLEALFYLKNRGISKKIIDKFELGYANNSWNSLKVELEKKYSREECVSAGLLAQKNSKCYDRFRNRIMFPIHNAFGKVTGFGGRTLRTDDDVPKYLNSPESDIFKKKNSLYGLYQNKNEIVQKKHAFLVEGYLDVLAMYQAGFKDVVAALGTAFTKDQALILSNLADKVTLVFDGDKAGHIATIKSIEKILGCGIFCDVVLLPKDKDIDNIINEDGSENARILFENSIDGVEYYISSLKKEAPKNISKWINNLLGSIEDDVVKKYCEQKFKKILGISVKKQKKVKDIVASNETCCVNTREKEILYCLAYGAFCSKKFQDLNGPSLLRTNLSKSICKKISENNDKETVYLSLSEQERLLWHEVASLNLSKDLQNHLSDDIEKLLKKEQRKSKREELRKKIVQLESNKDFFALHSVLAEFKSVMYP